MNEEIALLIFIAHYTIFTSYVLFTLFSHSFSANCDQFEAASIAKLSDDTNTHVRIWGLGRTPAQDFFPMAAY
jgi:hypothetical protein